MKIVNSRDESFPDICNQSQNLEMFLFLHLHLEILKNRSLYIFKTKKYYEVKVKVIYI